MIDEILSFSCFYYLNNRFVEAKVLKIYRELWSLIILLNFNSYDDLKEKRGREKSFKNFDTKFWFIFSLKIVDSIEIFT